VLVWLPIYPAEIIRFRYPHRAGRWPLTDQTGLPSSQVTIRTDDGKELTDSTKTLESYGLKGETATVFLDIR
jgi:hypothetical protein